MTTNLNNQNHRSKTKHMRLINTKILSLTSKSQSTNQALNRITYSEGIKFLPFWEGPDDGERVQKSIAYCNPLKVAAITLKK